MSRFSSAAKKATVVSELMTDKVKMSTEELIAKYPDGVHINAIDKVSTGGERNYTIFTIVENDKVFFNGGTIINKITDTWLDMVGGSIDDCNSELASEPVHCKFFKSQTKTGKNITKVLVLD